MMRSSRFAAALTLGACFAAHVLAQAGPATVLEHVRLIDGNGGTPVDDATIVIRGKTIVSAGPGPQHAEKSARHIDLSGKTVMPGIVSDHSHLGQVQNGKSGPGLYTRDNLLNQTAQWQAYGVTTITSLGLNDPAVFYPVRAQLHAGTLPSADIFGADRGIGVPDGAPPTNSLPGPYRPAKPDEARAAVREMAARHTDLIKVWVDDFHGSLHVKMRSEVSGAVIDEAHKNHLRVAAHVYYLADAKQLVREGVDILAHGVRDLPVDDEFIALMKQHGTWYIATLGLDEATYAWAEGTPVMDDPAFQHALSPGLGEHLNDPAWRAKITGNAKLVAESKASLQQNEQNLKRLYDAGVQIGFGTDSGANPERIPGFAEHRELQLSVAAGLTPLQAISVATRNAAALLHLPDRGTIAPGKRADFVVLDADPSQDVRNTETIRAVWELGRQVSGPIAEFQAH